MLKFWAGMVAGAWVVYMITRPRDDQLDVNHIYVTGYRLADFGM